MGFTFPGKSQRVKWALPAGPASAFESVGAWKEYLEGKP